MSRVDDDVQRGRGRKDRALLSEKSTKHLPVTLSQTNPQCPIATGKPRHYLVSYNPGLIKHARYMKRSPSTYQFNDSPQAPPSGLFRLKTPKSMPSFQTSSPKPFLRFSPDCRIPCTSSRILRLQAMSPSISPMGLQTPEHGLTVFNSLPPHHPTFASTLSMWGISSS